MFLILGVHGEGCLETYSIVNQWMVDMATALSVNKLFCSMSTCYMDGALAAYVLNMSRRERGRARE